MEFAIFDLLRSMANLIFIYPVDKLFKRYLRLMNDKAQSKEMFKYHFPRVGGAIDKYKNKKGDKPRK